MPTNSGDTRRLSELTVEDAKRVVVYAAAVVLAVWLFVALVGKVLVALLLGVVAAVYLLPVQEWLERRLRARGQRAHHHRAHRRPARRARRLQLVRAVRLLERRAVAAA